MVPLKEMVCNEEKAVRTCMTIFRDYGMQKVILVDESMSIRFKDTRICKCLNAQLEIDGNYYCVECHVKIKNVDEDLFLGKEEDSNV